MINAEQVARFREFANSMIAVSPPLSDEDWAKYDPVKLAEVVRNLVEFALAVPACVPDSVQKLQETAELYADEGWRELEQ